MRSWRDAFWGRPAFWHSPGDLDTWERRYARVLAVLPYVLLGVSTLLSQLRPYRTPEDRLILLGLALFAGAWVLFMYSLPPQRWREHSGSTLVYFAGLLVLSALLESRSDFFLAWASSHLLPARRPRRGSEVGRFTLSPDRRPLDPGDAGRQTLVCASPCWNMRPWVTQTTPSIADRIGFGGT